LREDDYDNLKRKSEKIGINSENLAWYFELRKSGYAPTAGFGLGLERLVMLITKVENIKDAIPFPRYYKHLDF
jgi:asparaginyl-tRNA synthetase